MQKLFTFNFSKKDSKWEKNKELKHKTNSKSSKATKKYNETKIIF